MLGESRTRMALSLNLINKTCMPRELTLIQVFDEMRFFMRFWIGVRELFVDNPRSRVFGKLKEMYYMSMGTSVSIYYIHCTGIMKITSQYSIWIPLDHVSSFFSTYRRSNSPTYCNSPCSQWSLSWTSNLDFNSDSYLPRRPKMFSLFHSL